MRIFKRKLLKIGRLHQVRDLAVRKPYSDAQGFSLPTAVGLGSIMLTVGFLMVARAQLDRSTAVQQVQTANSLALAEGGLARSLALLNGNFQILLRRSFDPINPLTGRTYLGPDGIPKTGDEETVALNEWSNISTNELPPCVDPSEFEDILLAGTIGNSTGPNYRLLAYRYNDMGDSDGANDIGTILIQGQGDIDTQQGNSNSATAVLVSMNISNVNADSNFPGLLAESINLGNNDVLGSISGNVVCTNAANCVVPPDACLNGTPTIEGLREAIGALRNGVVQGEIIIGPLTLPELPTAPTGASNLGNISGNQTLPRSGDRQIDGAFHYIVDDISLSGSSSLTINSMSGPVFLYVSGDISMRGNAIINHSGAPENFRIYGNPADSNNSNDQTFTINGGSSATNVFIYAPDAMVGINGGSSSPDIQGAVWAKTWDGSSSNVAEILVPDDLAENLGLDFPPTITTSRTSAAIRWERRPVR